MIYDRDDLVYLAKLSEKAGRYNDIANYMKKVAEFKQELSFEERNLIRIAYKNSIGAIRTSWRIVNNIELQELDKGIEKGKSFEYKKKIEKEFEEICGEVLIVLDNYLIPNSVQDESKVFYLKMKGDYYRYLAEILDKNTSIFPINAEDAYRKACKIANEKLTGLNPIKLALDYAVFCYEIKNEKAKGYEMARNAFDKAVSQIGNPNEDHYKDSILIIHI